VRSWDHWVDEKQARVHVLALDASGSPVGAPRDLTSGTKLAASPGFAGRQTDTGEEIDIEFTPDDAAIVFAATTNRDAAAYQSCLWAMLNAYPSKSCVDNAARAPPAGRRI
jgi:hypothetical protein